MLHCTLFVIIVIMHIIYPEHIVNPVEHKGHISIETFIHEVFPWCFLYLLDNRTLMFNCWYIIMFCIVDRSVNTQAHNIQRTSYNITMITLCCCLTDETNIKLECFNRYFMDVRLFFLLPIFITLTNDNSFQIIISKKRRTQNRWIILFDAFNM